MVQATTVTKCVHLRRGAFHNNGTSIHHIDICNLIEKFYYSWKISNYVGIENDIFWFAIIRLHQSEHRTILVLRIEKSVHLNMPIVK